MDNARVARVIREILERELAPLNFSCAQMRERIARMESALPHISDRHERTVLRVQLLQEHARLNAVISGLQDDCSVGNIVVRIKGRRGV
jgi:hypothetical protein